MRRWGVAALVALALAGGTGLAAAELPGVFGTTPDDGDDRRHPALAGVDADLDTSPADLITQPPETEESGEAEESEPDDDPDSTDETEETTDPNADTAEQVVRLVNEQRSAAGCGEVTVDDRLSAAATGHSRDMADNGYFDHTSQDGRDFGQRAAEQGYDWAIGENIAAGQRTAEEVMDAWMNSDGHRANILNCDANAIGMGIADDGAGTRYWTQMFGSR